MDETTMADSEKYRRHSLCDRSVFSLPFENEEIILDIKQPSLSSINLTDSWCSSASSQRNRQRCASESSCGQEGELFRPEIGSNCNSEPEDMQDIGMRVGGTEIDVDRFLRRDNKEDEMRTPTRKNNVEGFIDPSIFTSSPLSHSGKKISISLQDVSSFDIFPLIPKTDNAFSSETIQSQSMSSMSKSKDSGFQRSASCLSLNSGNRTYDHVQSKVKQYIKDIKQSEALRKRQQNVAHAPKTALANNSNGLVDNGSLEKLNGDSADLLKTVAALQCELKEKDSILSHLQENYNSLWQKYAEAVNQIDLMRLRNSSSYIYRSDDFNADAIDINASGSNLWPYRRELSSSNFNLSNHDFAERRSSDLSKEMSVSLSNFAKLSKVDNYNIECESIQPELHEPLSKVETDVNNSIKDKAEGKVDFSPQSGSHSTPVNSLHSVKSSLRPISKIFSSSSRLDRKVAPLPSSSVTNGGDKETKDRTEGRQRCDDYKSNHAEMRDDRSGTLVEDGDNGTPVRKTFRTLHLDLQKVDPFEKVKKWQASLPTVNLIGSHRSSSSLGSNDSLERLRYRNASTDNRRSTLNTFNSKSMCGKESDPKRSLKTNRCKSEQNLYTNPRIYSEYFMKASSANGFGPDKRNAERQRRTGANRRPEGSTEKRRTIKTDAFERKRCGESAKKCSRNVLRRSNALETETPLAAAGSEDSEDDSFLRHFVPYEEDKEEPQENSRTVGSGVADDSSSISSSILSSTMDNRDAFKNLRGCKNDRGHKPKTPRNNKSIEDPQRAELKYRSPTLNRNKSFCSPETLQHDVAANKLKLANGSLLHKGIEVKKNRVCFSPKNAKVNSHKSTTKFLSWEEPKSADPSKMNAVKATAPNSNRKKVLYQRTEKLKSYTEILSCLPKSCVIEIGIQVPDDEHRARREETKSIETPELVRKNRLDHLNEADEYLKQLQIGMSKLCQVFEVLKSNSKYAQDIETAERNIMS